MNRSIKNKTKGQESVPLIETVENILIGGTIREGGEDLNV